MLFRGEGVGCLLVGEALSQGHHGSLLPHEVVGDFRYTGLGDPDARVASAAPRVCCVSVLFTLLTDFTLTVRKKGKKRKNNGTGSD